MNRRNFLSLTAATIAAMSLKASDQDAVPEPQVGDCLAASMLFRPSSMGIHYLVDPRAIPHAILVNDETCFWKLAERNIGIKSDWGGFPLPKSIFWQGHNVPSFFHLNDEHCREMSNPKFFSHIRRVFQPRPFTLSELEKNRFTFSTLQWFHPPKNSMDEMDVMLVTLLDLASHTSEKHMPPPPVWGTRKQAQSLVSRMHDADYYLGFRQGYPKERQLLTHPDGLKAFVDARLRLVELMGTKPANWWVYTSKACPKDVAYLTAPKEWLGPFQRKQNGQIIMAVLNDTAVTKIEL